MIAAAAAPLVALLVAGATAWDLAGVEFAQSSVIIRQRMVIRVPVPAAVTAEPPPRVSRWREKKGPRCIRLRDVAGAAVMGDDTVDILFRGGLRVRARLEDACPALGFYGGFYLRPGADGRVCADRDAVHARSGGACEIERFRLLVPAGSSRPRP